MFDDGDDDGDSQDINAMHDSVTSPTITGIRGVFSIRDVMFFATRRTYWPTWPC